MEGNVSRDQFLTRVCVSCSLLAIFSREDIIKEGGSQRLARGGGSGRKKIDLKKNPGLEGSPTPGLVCKLF